MKQTIQKIFITCAILIFSIHPAFNSEYNSDNDSNSFSSVLTTKAEDIENQNTENSHTTSTITEAAGACCLFNCACCTAVTTIGAVWAPATFSYCK